MLGPASGSALDGAAARFAATGDATMDAGYGRLPVHTRHWQPFRESYR